MRLTQLGHDLLCAVSLLHEESFPAAGRPDSLTRPGSTHGEGVSGIDIVISKHVHHSAGSRRRRTKLAGEREFLGDAGGHASFPTILPSTVVGSKLYEILYAFGLLINCFGTPARLDFL